MKALPRWSILAVLLCLFLGSQAPGDLITFEDVATGTNTVPLPRPYRGLQWNGIYATDGSVQPATSAYRLGIISGPNVAFSVGGVPVSLTSPVAFDLQSAYLTAVSVPGLQVEVQGWVGNQQAYHNTYTLNPTGPTLVQFNYAGVTEVRFIPSPMSGFVMDDVSIGYIPCRLAFDPPSFAHGPGVETGTVRVTTQSGCVWTTQTEFPWVTILSRLIQTNSGVFSYRVASNSGAFPRRCTLDFEGQPFVIDQAAGLTAVPLITFEDAAGGPLPNPYRGMSWNGFFTLNGLGESATSGYRRGLVSGSNVAFNGYANPVSITSSIPFDLQSAYVTSAGLPSLRLDVQGWVGNRLAYLNNYTLNPFGPTLVQFNYAGVTEVRFDTSPMSTFAMDNVTRVFTESTPCWFAVEPALVTHGSGAETGAVHVTTQSGCAWAVHNTNSWVTILSSLNQTGEGIITYRVAANPIAITRVGTIRIADQIITVRQATGQPPISYTPLNLGTVVVSRIGHTLEADFLIDQDQSSGGGSVLPVISANWDTNIQFTLTVSAPAGEKIFVDVPPGHAVKWGGMLLWESGRGGNSPSGPVSGRFQGLEGYPFFPTTSSAELSTAQGFFGFLINSIAYSGQLAFSSITLTGTVAVTYTGLESQQFHPHPQSSLGFFDAAPGASHPVPFVFLVPTAWSAGMSKLYVTSILPDSTVTLRVHGEAGRTHVVEASADLRHWTPISTNVMPSTGCVGCPYFYMQDVPATIPERRFFRVVALP